MRIWKGDNNLLMFHMKQEGAIQQHIANNIARLREAQGMTQLDLGLALGYQEENAQSRISQYETGSRSPGKKTLDKIAQALHVPADQLIREEPAQYGKPDKPSPEADPFARRIVQILVDLDPESKRAVLKYAEEKKLVAHLRKKNK